MAGIDRGLAADRGIDLRQQRGRHLDVIDAAAHHRRRKPGKIADHAAAERHHDDRRARSAPRAARRRRARTGETFAALARRHDHRRRAAITGRARARLAPRQDDGAPPSRRSRSQPCARPQLGDALAERRRAGRGRSRCHRRASPSATLTVIGSPVRSARSWRRLSAGAVGRDARRASRR